MNIITSEARFRQRVIKYSYRNGVTQASIRFHRSRNAIYEWRARCDDKIWTSLVEKSHRPYHHPNEHTPKKKEMILRRSPRYQDDMIMLRDSLRKSRYTRWAYRELYDEHSTYRSVTFLKGLITNSPFPIREVQTDNGAEWTRALISNDGKPSLIVEALETCQIKYHRIRVATPRHNGKVERQHRIDELRFYKKMRMYNFTYGRKQLAKYNIPKICLEFMMPNEALEKYLYAM